ncbi:MAG: PH domain-containing protein [Planctomycetota bacterium]
MFERSQTKVCPFCAEIIQARALKCRFCGEFLNTDKAEIVKAMTETGREQAEEQEQGNILFCGRPSLWGMAGSVMRGLIILGIACLLLYYPLENLPMFHPIESQGLYEDDSITESRSSGGLTVEQVQVFRKYRILVGAGLAVLVVLMLLVKAVRLKMIYYEVSSDRIEWGRGIFDRRIDNMDMFRVIDLKLRRSLLDCIVGVGTIGLITTDKTDPEFKFEKIRGARRLYDIIKKASLDADRKNSVIHLE